MAEFISGLISLLVLFFIAGFSCGAAMKQNEFIGNADEPMRIHYKGEFYKVYRLSRHGHGVHSDPGGHLENQEQQEP